MKRQFLFIILSYLIIQSGFSQSQPGSGGKLLFHGVVLDANSLTPITNSQILINRIFTSVSSVDGSFAFLVNRNDTVLFRHLGYKPAVLIVSDTLSGKDFIAGIYLNSDTLAIAEVIIVPRYNNLRSEILNSPSKVPPAMDNARYNVAISAYQGRTTQGRLGDPSANYGVLHERQKMNAYEKGGIPSDKIAGISPLLLIPGAYLLIHGLPEKPPPLEKQLTPQELYQINKKFMDSLKPK